MRRAMVLACLIGALLATAASSAFASVGVGTDVRSIELTEPLAAGGTYELQRFAIINTGTQEGGYSMLVAESLKSGTPVPEDWLSFTPGSFYLFANQAANVETVLRIPVDATPGTYRTRLLGVPTIAGQNTDGGQVNVGVGPSLVFEVVQPNLLQRVYFSFMGWMPWSGIALAALGAGIVGGAWIGVSRKRRSMIDAPDREAEPTHE